MNFFTRNTMKTFICDRYPLLIFMSIVSNPNGHAINESSNCHFNDHPVSEVYKNNVLNKRL